MDFLKFTDRLNLSGKLLYSRYLTSFGRAELDFMIVYFMRYLNVERVQICVHLIGILLLFLAPWEVFAIMKILIERSALIKRHALTKSEKRE